MRGYGDGRGFAGTSNWGYQVDNARTMVEAEKRWTVCDWSRTGDLQLGNTYGASKATRRSTAYFSD